jgi:hypothetical protein
MKRIIISIVSIFFGLAAVLIWEMGSHGNRLRFRAWMVEDWILVLLVIFFWGLPVYFIINWARKRQTS